MEGVGSLLFLLCSTTKHSREFKAVMLVADRFITGSIVTTDCSSGWESALTLMQPDQLVRFSRNTREQLPRRLMKDALIAPRRLDIKQPG